MKANELRHGNWIDTKEFHVEKLRGIYQYDSSWYEYVSMFKPIPLTEEWLLKFGFEKLTKRFRISIGCYWYTVWNSGQFDVDNKAISFNCKYVHQLQNLYFALTGEELEIK